MRIVTLVLVVVGLVGFSLALSTWTILRGEPLARGLRAEWTVGRMSSVAGARATDARTVEIDSLRIVEDVRARGLAANATGVRWERPRLLPRRGVVSESQLRVDSARLRLRPRSIERATLFALPEKLDCSALTIEIDGRDPVEWKEVRWDRRADGIEIRFRCGDASARIEIPRDPDQPLLREVDLEGAEWQLQSLTELLGALAIRAPLPGIDAKGRIDFHARASGDLLEASLQHDPSTLRFPSSGIELRFASGTVAWTETGPVEWSLQRAIVGDRTACDGRLTVDGTGVWRGTLDCRIERRRIDIGGDLPETGASLLSAFGRRVDFDGQVRIEGRLEDGWSAIAEADGKFAFDGDGRKLQGDVRWIRTSSDFSVRGRLDRARTFGWSWPSGRFSGEFGRDGTGWIEVVPPESPDSVEPGSAGTRTTVNFDREDGILLGRIKTVGWSVAHGLDQDRVRGVVDVSVRFQPPQRDREGDVSDFTFDATFEASGLEIADDVSWIPDRPRPRSGRALVETKLVDGVVELSSLRFWPVLDLDPWDADGRIDSRGRWHLDLELPPATSGETSLPTEFKFDGALFQSAFRADAR